ncbi:MAG TPA: PilC/PilY family type IV pilus protein [Rhodanobacteraceae bacterium]|nr:PilC/PilY family type IV pilus protein [Rhodanobacteraceae bacterium]
MTLKSLRNFLLAAALSLGGGMLGPAPIVVVAAAATPTPLAISQVPLTVAMPAHPQVLFAIGNSQSMDGDLSGAIMTGSGVTSSGNASLTNSSSPVNYTVPAGFTPPVSGYTGPTAPYTVLSGGTEYDNSASRLNVAKAAMTAIITAYAQNTQFALEDYSVGSALYSTWVYQMSGPGGFTFSTTNTSPPAGFEYVPNPCYQYTTASATVKSNCTAIAPLYAAGVLAGNQYMLVQNSSDDADVNDVLYWTGGTAAFVDYGTRSNPNPYPPYFTLSNYNNGGVSISYASVLPTSGIKETGPTNAGFVPYSDQVFYAQRGFGYYSNASATTGNIVVPMQSTGSTQAQVNAILATFAPALAPETNNSSTKEIKAAAVQSPLAGLLQKAKSYMAGVTKPSGCTQQYVILISDGLPTEDLNGKSWPPLGSAAAAGYGVSATFNSDGSLNATNDQALTDTITAIQALKTAGINTYVVGMGAGVDPSANPQAAATLTAMAVAGGTGSYFAASSPADLVKDLNNILVSIQNGSLSSTSVAVNSGSLNTDSMVFQATFTVQDSQYQDWTGDINAYPINADGSVSTTSSWSAKKQLNNEVVGTGWQNRVIATLNPTGGPAGYGVGEPFLWTDLTATQQADLTLGSDPVVTPPTLSNAQLRLNYLSGDTSHEQHNGGAFRNRTGILGDIVDSNPLYVNQPLGPYLDASYQAFEQTYAKTPRPAVLYAGADDGMLHAFDPTTGNELFAFVPNAVFANLINLTSPFYNSNHQFFVDGAPHANDVLFGSDGKWHTELVGGENAGGNSIYALDITDPQNFTSGTPSGNETALANAVLWEFTDANMGLSYSAPIIARINADPVTDAASGKTAAGFAVMFGNGYNSASEMPYFYAVKPDTGAIIAKINLCNPKGLGVNPACNTSLPNGLSSVVAANSSGVLGFPVDEVYAGDLQGNLWAIDVGDPNPSNWTVRLLFQARDGSGNPQPITTAPVVTLNPNYPAKLGLMVFFGTGQLLQNSDLTNTKTQSFYGVWDNGSTTPATRANLQVQTLTAGSIVNASGATQNIRTASSNSVNWSTQQGWYMDLPLSGERVISSAVIENGGVVFTTYTPQPGSGTTCTAGGVSWLMDLAYGNGGPFDKAELDVYGNGNLNSSKQQSGGQNPVGMQLSNSYVPTPSIVHAFLPSGVGALKVVSQPAPNGAPSVGAVKERGHGPTRAGWWQIQ